MASLKKKKKAKTMAKEPALIDYSSIKNDLEQARMVPMGLNVIPPTRERPKEGSVFGAMLRTEHTLGEFFMPHTGRYTRQNIVKDPNFDPIPLIPYDLKNYAYAFAEATDENSFYDILFRVRQQLRDKEVIANAPGRSFIAGLLLGVVDPTMALPGGAIYKSAKTQFNILKSGLSVGAAGAVQSIVQEAVLHKTQETRTLEESIWNTAATALMAGTIGATGSWFANTPVGRKAKQDTLNELMIGPPSPEPYPFGMGPYPTEPKGPTQPGGKSASAAFADYPGYLQQSESLYGLGKFFSTAFGKNPLAPTMIKMMYSDFPEAKKAAFDLFENNLLQNKNVFHYEATQHAIETYINDARKRFLAPQIEFFNIFLDSIGAKNGFIGDLQATLNWKNFERFSEASGFAARRGDKSDNPHVQQAVDTFRGKVFEPVKNWMKALGVLPEDLEKVATADSYLPKIINVAKVIANPEKFKKIIFSSDQ